MRWRLVGMIIVVMLSLPFSISVDLPDTAYDESALLPFQQAGSGGAALADAIRNRGKSIPLSKPRECCSSGVAGNATSASTSPVTTFVQRC